MPHIHTIVDYQCSVRFDRNRRGPIKTNITNIVTRFCAQLYPPNHDICKSSRKYDLQTYDFLLPLQLQTLWACLTLGPGTTHAVQAGGSSLLAKLTNLLAADALRLAGLADLGAVTVLPLATGMALTTTLLALRLRLPPTARYVPIMPITVFQGT